ncbi:MAG: SDR family NAD(P)-dependent oxidoreductase [Deltaproteobacteria bacterium]|nr:SDR family NAD(P)-dependent oxidoreductase [Deltaproteobacteria bacterium]
MKEIKGCNALITGASRGIGVSIAEKLAEEGVNLALTARSMDALEQVRNRVGHMGVRAVAVPADLSRLDSLESLVCSVERELGPVDILINNAAIESTAAYETLSLEEIRNVIDVNLVAPMIITRLILPGMQARGRGHIVNISSLEGLLPLPFNEVYSATKHALMGFTCCLHLSFQMRRSALDASVICPGAVARTGMYQRAVDSYGKNVEITSLLGTSPPGYVADAVLRAIRREKLITTVGRLILPLHLLSYSMPRLAEWVARANGWFEPLRYYIGAKSRDKSA